MITRKANGEQGGLDRYLSSFDAWAMAYGCMVGWGTFVMPGTTFLPIAGPAGTVIAMMLGAIVMLIVARSVSWLMNRSPRTGGLYSYTKEAFGRDHAFLCAWFLSLSYLTIVFLNGSALFVVVRTIFGDSIQAGLSYTIGENTIYLREVLTSVLAVAAVGVTFVAAKPQLQKLQSVLAAILAIGVAVLAALCLPHAFASGDLGSFGTRGVGHGFAIFSLMLLAPWAFVGFEIISFDTAHFKFPVKRSWAIAAASIAFACFSYVAMALVSMAVVPDGYASWADYINDLESLSGVAAVPTFYAARVILGPAGLAVMAVDALAAILTGIIGGYRAMMRVLSTMAEDRILSEHFSDTSRSIIFIMVLSILISFLGRNTLVWFVDLTSFGAIVAFGYVGAAAFRIARSEGNRAIMALGGIAAVISSCFAIVQLVPGLAAVEAMGSEAFLLLSLWCLLGFVFYWRTIQRSSLTEYSGMSISGTVLFALLVYSAIMWMGKRTFAAEGLDEMRGKLEGGIAILLVIIFVGLTVMLYIQKVVREKHNASEREKIRAVEGSLAKSQFLFNMSHDIRTPMNAIIGYTNLARKEESSDAVRGYLDRIDMSSNQLLSLINDILEMSRIESGKLEQEYVPCSLDAVLDEISNLFDEQMRQKGLRFAVHGSQVAHRYVWCDRRSVNRVLLNLVSNAFKFTPEGGEVSVTLLENGVVEGSYGSYELRVKDSGIGMSTEFVDKMFVAFERERTSTASGMEGTGLGLAITKSLVDLMGGTIDVLTSPGGGTEFIVRLKLRLAEESEVGNAEKGKAAGARTEINAAGKRLLLVEDNAINMEISHMILTQRGFEVEMAENGKIALDMVAASQPGYYDAILMDIQMPVMNGYEATRAIRALPDAALAGIPILAMTANAFEEDVQAAAEAGMQAHIPKPVDVSVLMAELANVLAV